MSRGAPRPEYTPARHAWLAHLRYEPLHRTMRRGSVVGYQCMSLGWTQWVWVQQPGGRRMRIAGETLTEEGLRMLMEWQIRYGKAALLS